MATDALVDVMAAGAIAEASPSPSAASAVERGHESPNAAAASVRHPTRLCAMFSWSGPEIPKK